MFSEGGCVRCVKLVFQDIMIVDDSVIICFSVSVQGSPKCSVYRRVVSSLSDVLFE